MTAFNNKCDLTLAALIAKTLSGDRSWAGHYKNITSSLPNFYK